MKLNKGQNRVLADFLANLTVALLAITVIAPIFTLQEENIWLLSGSGVVVSGLFLYLSINFAKEIL